MIDRSHASPRLDIDPALPVYPSMAHVLRAAVEQRPDTTAVIFEDRQIDYRSFGRAVNGLALHLAETGVAPGDRVIVMMPNGIEMDVALMAVMTSGAQVAPVNPFFTVPELTRMLDGIDAVAIICDPVIEDKAARTAEMIGGGDVILLGAEAVSIDPWMADPSLDVTPDPLPGPDDLALLIFTGGSTGVPKGVDHTHRGLMWGLRQHCTAWPVTTGEEVFLNVAPMFHIWGLSYATWVPIYAQSTLVMVPRYDPNRVVEALGTHRVTVFGGGPAPIYMGLLASPVFDTADLSALRLCLSGGAPCPEDLHREWERRVGRPLLEGWGMSEGAPFCLNHAGAERKMLSVGNPVPETEIQIVDLEPGERLLPIGEAGEVRVRGPQLMSGYRNNPTETERTLRNGWIYTGDIGYLDSDGYLFLVDRKKDMVVVGGYNVYPREVDEVLFDHPKIREAATVGRPDPRLGEVVVAFVVLDEDVEMTADEVLDHCRTNLVKYKRPVEVHFIDALPRTGTNKIDRISLRRTFQ